MVRSFIVRGIAVAVSACAVLVIAVVGTWILLGGVAGALSAAWRELRYGTTTVYDYRHYPARALVPSPLPLPFGAAKRGASPAPTVEAFDGRSMPLAELLAATDTLALVVIQNDSIVFEHYAADRGVAALSQYFSVSKSILATLMAMAIDGGLVHSNDGHITRYLPELESHGFATVTLKQLINMSTDLDYMENDNPCGLHVLMNYTSQLEPLDLGFHLRGTGANPFEYRSGESALLSLALKRALGRARCP